MLDYILHRLRSQHKMLKQIHCRLNTWDYCALWPNSTKSSCAQIWLNLLMHDCQCDHIFFQEKVRTAFFIRGKIETCELFCVRCFHPSSNVCLCHQNYYPCSCHPAFAYYFRTCLLTMIGPSQGPRDKKKLIGQKNLFFHWSQNWRKKTHTPLSEKRDIKKNNHKARATSVSLKSWQALNTVQ